MKKLSKRASTRGLNWATQAQLFSQMQTKNLLLTKKLRINLNFVLIKH